MKHFTFRAIYFKNREDGEVDYSSAPINEAEEPYDTIGLYDLSKGKENIEENHIADMPGEDFQLVLDSPFPNGFMSWQKTHFEMVKILTIELSKKEVTFPLFHHLKKHLGKEGLYTVAFHLTNKFENIRINKKSVGNFQEEVEKFLKSELENEV